MTGARRGKDESAHGERPDAGSHWVWGAFKMPGATLHQLHRLWLERGRRDEYIGTLVNAYLEQGGAAWGVRAGQAYVDVGTLHGYREAIGLLSVRAQTESGSSGAGEPPLAHSVSAQGATGGSDR